MLYIAFVRARRDIASDIDVRAKSEQWWNKGARPERLHTVAIIGSMSTATPDVFVFEADGHDDINRMVNFWSDVADLEVHPAVDLAEQFRSQGMKIE